MYNLTDIGMSTTFYEYMTGLNSVLNDAFGIVILVASYLIVMSLTNRDTAIDSNLMALFISSIAAGLLWALNWLSFEYAVVPLLLLILVFSIKVIYK